MTAGLPVAVTMGEPAGVGGELTLISWMARERAQLPAFFAIDDPARLEQLSCHLGWDVPIVSIEDPGEVAEVFPNALPILPQPLAVPVVFGKPDPFNARGVIDSIDRAVGLAMTGDVCAVVTNPIQKSVLYSTGFAFPGHTEYLAHLAGTSGDPVMMLEGGGLRVVLATIHIALSEVSRVLSSDTIVDVGRKTVAALKCDFGIAEPRLAIAALNPHAGEGGAMGREEIEIIAPAVARLTAEGIDASGPLSADTLFHAAARARYDAVLCQYHDQGLIPLKTLDFDTGVNITLGLPFVRTSPDHGTALDIAGRGQANPASLQAALRTAAAIAERRLRAR